MCEEAAGIIYGGLLSIRLPAPDAIRTVRRASLSGPGYLNL
jgi:hypothetical protein